MHTGDTATVLITWRWKQWLCSRCWYPEHRGSKFFQNVGVLMMQTEDSSKLLVPWSWRQWVPPKCWYLEDTHNMFLHNFSIFKMHTAVSSKVLVPIDQGSELFVNVCSLKMEAVGFWRMMDPMVPYHRRPHSKCGTVISQVCINFLTFAHPQICCPLKVVWNK